MIGPVLWHYKIAIVIPLKKYKAVFQVLTIRPQNVLQMPRQDSRSWAKFCEDPLKCGQEIIGYPIETESPFTFIFCSHCLESLLGEIGTAPYRMEQISNDIFTVHKYIRIYFVKSGHLVLLLDFDVFFYFSSSAESNADTMDSATASSHHGRHVLYTQRCLLWEQSLKYQNCIQNMHHRM